MLVLLDLDNNNACANTTYIMSPIYTSESQLTTLYMTCQNSLDTFFQSSLTSLTTHVRVKHENHNLIFPVSSDASWKLKKELVSNLDQQTDIPMSKQSGLKNPVCSIVEPSLAVSIPQWFNRKNGTFTNSHQIDMQQISLQKSTFRRYLLTNFNLHSLSRE